MNKNLTKKEILEIVDMHLQIFPSDLLPQLGKTFLINFYTYINNSKYEDIFIIKEKKILAICIISFEIETLIQRVIKSYLLCFCFSFFLSTLKNKLFREYIFNIISHKSNFKSKNPEIVYLFTNPLFINNGLGTKLIKKIENKLIQYNISKYYSKTLSQNNNKTIEFYKKNNFKIENQFKYAGKSYLYLSKQI